MQFLGSVGSAQNKTAATTVAITASQTIPAGSFLVMIIGADNTNATNPTISSITTAGGGTWNARGSGSSGATATAGAGVFAYAYSVITNTQISSGSTISTVTFSSSPTAKAVEVVGFSNVIQTIRGTPVSGSSTGGAPSAVITNPVAGDLVIGLAVGENNAAITGDADTTNGTWSTLEGINTSGGSAATNITAGIQYKEVTASGTQTYNPTTSNDSVAIVFTVQLPLETTASGTSTSTGSINDIFYIDLRGSAQSTSTGSAAAKSSGEIDLSGQSTSTGSILAGILSPTSGSGLSTSTASGQIRQTLRATGSGASLSTGSGSIVSLIYPVASGLSTSTGQANAVGTYNARANDGLSTSTGQANAIGTYNARANDGLSTSTGTGSIRQILGSTMTAQAFSSGQGAITKIQWVVALGQSLSTGSGAMFLSAPISASGQSTSTGSGAIRQTQRTTASGASTSTGSLPASVSVGVFFVGWGSPM